jgi:tryptophan synthase beta chain
MDQMKYNLTEDQMPTSWYNVAADLPFPLAPPLHPGTKQPLDPSALEAIFPKSLIAQEISQERWISIPPEVQEILRLWRPTPLRRARRLEHALKTTCKIYYKDESASPTGSHKTNTAVPQAYYNKMAGIKHLTTETGAGQWGTALSFATNVFGLSCKIYMVKVSYQQKPFRKSLMHIWGANVIPSPSDKTNSGRAILAKDPHCPGSLGIAISEAVEEAAQRSDTNYSLGSVLNHVLLHQTVIGLEAKQQLESAGDQADYVIGCVGGGSNFGGLAFPFIPDKLKRKDLTIIGVEPSACPTLTKGVFAYDFGDTSMLTPLIKMHTLGHTFIPPGIHAGGLRYHGCSPLVSALLDQKLMEARAVPQTQAFEAAVLFAKAEGIVPAPESSHAVKVAIDIARSEKKPKTIVFNLSGHGFLDLASYDKYLAGDLKDFALPDEAIAEALLDLPKI